MGLIPISNEGVFHAVIYILLIIVSVGFYFQWRNVKSLKRDIHILNVTLSQSFLTEKEFIILVNLEKNRLTVKNPHDFQNAEYKRLIELLLQLEKQELAKL